MLLRVSLIVIVLLCGIARAQEITVENFQSLPLAEFEARLPAEHPVIIYMFAGRLFNEGKRDDAVKWFYIGQLRWRFRLAANPDFPRSGEPAMLASLTFSLGGPINEWAGGAPSKMVESIDEALRWDDENENTVTSKEIHRGVWQDVRAGLEEFRDMIRDRRDFILEERRRQGGEVRE